MRWIRKNDTFILKRNELAELHLLACSIGGLPKKYWPNGYLEMRKQLLSKSSHELLKYLKFLKEKRRRK
jgi:hypothetical protein